MNLLFLAFIFVGSVCFTLGFLHLLIYIRRKDLKTDLAFSTMAIAIAFSLFFEFWAFQTSSLPLYISVFKTTLFIQCILWICFAWFVYFYTESDYLWPPVLITLLYSLALAINYFSPSSILFKEIVELTAFTVPSGEIVYLANGTANPFRIVADIAWIILLLYTAVSSVLFGKRGNGRKATLFATTIFLSLGFGYLHGTLIDLGLADPPYLGSILFLPLAIVMSFSLAGNVVESSYLAIEIKNAEVRWRNLLENVHLIILGVDQNTNIFYANPHFLTLTGYEKNKILNTSFINIIPEKDRETITRRFISIFSGHSHVNPERHQSIITKSGEQREILWSSVELTGTEKTSKEILSIGKDVTGQIRAESSRDQAISELESLKIKLEKENFSLKEMINVDHSFKEIVGKSNSILYVLNKIQQVSKTDSTVLILGETGTGKELVAQAIHQGSSRKNQPFIRVNCAAIPDDLVESELFGHEQGAFTNATNLRRGKFELADGGTIFLDEISEMPIETQAKLLNVLQERELERIGGSNTIPIDVRVISATNRDLDLAIAKGHFRPDLFYRLNIYPITLPPLRHRKEDIPLLVSHFISIFNKRIGKNIYEVPHPVMDILKNYDWPGNIRELRNILERAMITCNSSTFKLPAELKPSNGTGLVTNTIQDLLPLAEVERQHIERALEETNWQVSGMKGAARILQINPSTLRSRIRKLKLKKP